MQHRLLIVEDDALLREGLVEMLTREGYLPLAADGAHQARLLMASGGIDLVLLDVSLPDGDGFSLCRGWRGEGRQMPILFLTARDEEMDVVRGLDAGGDDYVAKPFRLQELLSRVRALLRWHEPAREDAGGITIDHQRMQAFRDGEPLLLTPTELRLLMALRRARGSTLSRGQLLRLLWEEGGQYVDDNTLSVHMSRLREKIGAEHIGTVRGVGYQWLD